MRNMRILAGAVITGAVIGTAGALAAPAIASTHSNVAGVIRTSAARIHTAPHVANTTVGICEGGDAVNLLGPGVGDNVACPCGGATNSWERLTDLRTGTTGWVSSCFIN